MRPIINKYSVIIACAAAMLATGVHYVWSIFQSPVMEYFAVTSSNASLVFYLFVAFNVVGIIIGGRICDRMGPRLPVIIGSLIYIAGLIASSFVPQDQFKLLYFTYSGMVSFGGGFVYTCAISCAKIWWPERKGVAGGFVVSMLGASTLILAPTITALISSPSIGLMKSFRVLGLSFLVILAIASVFMRYPDVKSGSVSQSGQNVRSKETTIRILKNKSYYLLMICLIIAPFAYNTVNPLMKILGAERGLSETVIGSMIMVSGIASAIGRLLFGKMCDNTSSRNVFSILFLVSFVCILGLAFAQGGLFYGLTILLTCAYGGIAGITPMLAVDYFGSENSGTSFGMLMIAVLFSSLLSPVVISAIATLDGKLTVWNFIVAAILSIVGLAVIRINRLNKDTVAFDSNAAKAAEEKIPVEII